jgi:hypothetical protein
MSFIVGIPAHCNSGTFQKLSFEHNNKLMYEILQGCECWVHDMDA